MPDQNTFNVDPSTAAEAQSEPQKTEEATSELNTGNNSPTEVPDTEPTMSGMVAASETTVTEPTIPEATETPETNNTEVPAAVATIQETPAAQSKPDLDKQLEQNLEAATGDTPAQVAKESKVKTYIIMAIAAVTIVVFLFIGWKAFFGGDDAAEIASTIGNQLELTNSLSSSSSSDAPTEVSVNTNATPPADSTGKLEELEEIVEELEAIYTEKDPEVFKEALLEDIEPKEETEGDGVSR